jgi:hypothetical protein
VRSECPNCGASVSFDDGVIADRCVFCGSTLVAGAARGDHADRVAPFLIPRPAAEERIATYLQGQWLAPRAVRESAGAGAVKGVLVPFWVHDAEARSRWTASVGIYWTRTETYTVTVTRDGKTTRETRTRQVRETEWFPTSGTHVHSARGHLVSGSKGLPEAEANALEPFDLGAALPYAPALLAGWVAESPTLPRSEAQGVARVELEAAQRSAIQRFLPGDTARGLSVESAIEIGAVSLVLLPVWIATFSWDGAAHRLLVNGQTGEVVGAVPTAWAKIAALVVAGLLAAAGAVAFVLLLVGVSQ